MNFLLAGLRTIRRLVSEKLGVCPFCMRASARGAIAAWALYALGRAFERRLAVPPFAWTLLLACAWALTLLIAAHLVTYMARRAARIRAIERGVGRDRPPNRLLTRREFASLVLGAGAAAAAIALFDYVPAQAGIVNCPGTFDMNREGLGFGTTDTEADESFKDSEATICDLFCATKICASGGCVRNTVVPPVHGDKKFGPGPLNSRRCTATIKQCSCTCSTCSGDHSLNRWLGSDYASGAANNLLGATAEMMKQAREKCDKECGRYRDCHPNPPLNCKRNGDPAMDPDTLKHYGEAGTIWVTQRVKTCHCSCQDAPPAPGP